MALVDTTKMFADILIPGLSNLFVKKLTSGISTNFNSLLSLSDPLKKLYNGTNSPFLKELIKSTATIKERKAKQKLEANTTVAESVGTVKPFVNASVTNNGKIPFNAATIIRNNEQEETDDENIADLLWEHLSTLAEDITQLAQLYTPIDTGLLISSFYYKTGDRYIELGFDLDKCPYASIVHEKHNVRHPNGGTDQFLYYAVVDAVKQFDFAKDINIEFIVNRNELKVILNGENNNISELFDDSYTSPFNEEELGSQFYQFMDLNFNTQDQLPAYIARFEKQREILTGKKQHFVDNFLSGLNYSNRLSNEQRKQADLRAFRSVDTNEFSYTEINDPRRLFAFFASSKMTFTRPAMFTAMKNTNI